MKLTIIRSDNTVYKDGVALQVDCSSLDPNIRAIQWDGTAGWIEYEDYSRETPIKNLKKYRSIVSAWEVAYAAQQKAFAPPTLEQTKKFMSEQAYKYLELKLNLATVNVVLSSGTHTFGCDATTRENIAHINTLIVSGGIKAVPNPRPWVPKGSNIEVQVTHDEFASIGAAIMQKRDQLSKIYFNHKNTINALTEVDVVSKYDVTKGYE